MDILRAIQRVESEDVSIGLATQTPPGRQTHVTKCHTSPVLLPHDSETIFL